MLLAVKAIAVDFDAQRVVDTTSLDLASGDIVTIAGLSGSGKSTLLRAMATLIPLSSGEIELEGRRAPAVGLAEYRRRVAYVPQSPRMFEGTVADNLRAGPGFRGLALGREAVDSLLRTVGLPSDLAQRRASDISGGERMRVALARALANEPRVLLLDEPTASLDPAAARSILEQIVSLAARGMAVAVVTHAEGHASHLGGRAYRMQAGRLDLLNVGPP